MTRYYASLLLILSVYFAPAVCAQNYLNKPVTLSVQQQPLESVLANISKQTGVVFSYHTNIISKDSLVTIIANRKTLKDVLNQLLGSKCTFKEKGHYLIIQSSENNRYWYVSGYVRDGATGELLSNVSVYETEQLVATLTNEDGYFKIRFKESKPSMNINVSRMAYNDLTFYIKPGQDQEVNIKITSKDYDLDTVVVTNRQGIENSLLGRLFLSSKQKLQSMNVGKFLVNKPFQVSLVPALGTHGSMSSQVVNKVSLNVLGGYNAGVDGAEVGGLVNLIKNDISGVQLGGIYNMAGGNVKGVQIGGISNFVSNNTEGVQIAGVYSHVGGALEGTQISGISSFTDSSLQGWQVAGIANFTRDNTDGVQISGVANVVGGEVHGAQISGIFNYTKKLKGVQIGLINICDTSDGYSIGLINISKNGYHKFSIFNTDIAHVNVGLKTGNKKIYTILFAGMNAGVSQPLWTFGGGIGAAYTLGKKLTLNPEITMQHLYLGDWDHYNLLNRISVQLEYQFMPFIAAFAGPVYNVYTSNQTLFKQHFHSPIPNSGVTNYGQETNGWLGWSIGVSLF